MSDAEWLVTAAGFLGAAFILVCFVGNLAGRMSAQSHAYLMLNLAGGILVALNSFWFRAYPAFLINIIWTAASVWGLYRSFIHRRGDTRARR